MVVRVLDVWSGHHVEGGGEEADEQAPEELCRAAALGEDSRDADKQHLADGLEELKPVGATVRVRSRIRVRVGDLEW